LADVGQEKEARRGSTPEFSDRENQLLAAATEIFRRRGPESVSLASLSRHAGVDVEELTRVFPSTRQLRDRHGQYLAVWLARRLLAAAGDGPPSAGLALVELWESDPDLVSTVLTGSVFSAGESLALDVVRALLPDAVIPDDEVERRRWFAGIRSHGHTAIMVAATGSDEDSQAEILAAAIEGAASVSDVMRAGGGPDVDDTHIADLIHLPL
jgi:AcrR family transcriptional regulator